MKLDPFFEELLKSDVYEKKNNKILSSKLNSQIIIDFLKNCKSDFCINLFIDMIDDHYHVYGYGQTIAHYICNFCSAYVISVMVTKNIDLQSVDHSEQTPMHNVCNSRFVTSELICTCVKHGMNLYQEDKYGKKPVDLILNPEIKNSIPSLVRTKNARYKC